MKIGTLTFHTALNYGAVLQAYALVKYIQSLGYEAEIIDYRAEFNEKRFSTKPFKYFLSIRVLYNILFRNSYQKHCHYAFKDFFDNYLLKSKKIYNLNNISEIKYEYDKIITGSDQVWNLGCTDNDDTYFLKFLPKEKKYSYAASFGENTVSEKYIDQIKKNLSTFTSISVREREGANIVKNLTGRDATVVLDPTFLLDIELWRKIADFSICPKKKYLLIYLMSEDCQLLKFAERYAKFHGLEVVYITQRLFKRIKAKYLKNVTPNQWVGLFLQADTIVTNSFHGMAFSINFGKNFFVKYIPRSVTNSRLFNLIAEYKLEDRLLTERNIKEVVFSDINYENIKDVLCANREKSHKFITDNILSK